MTPLSKRDINSSDEQRQRRIEAAAVAMSEFYGGRPDRSIEGATRALDAADRAVPMVTEEWANSSEHPNWEAGWLAGHARGIKAGLQRERPQLNWLQRLLTWVDTGRWD